MDVLLRQQIETLFNPSSVAVFTSFPNTAWGLGVVHRLMGSQREVYPMRENVAEVLGVKVYPSMAHVPGTVDVAVIAAYIEGLREGKRFFELARRVTQQKPIVVIYYFLNR